MWAVCSIEIARHLTRWLTLIMGERSLIVQSPTVGGICRMGFPNWGAAVCLDVAGTFRSVAPAVGMVSKPH